MEPVRDYSGNLELSLDDYIKKNPGALRDIKIKTSKPRIRPPSQQWRLGRNGARPLKRLGRAGPLRPFRQYAQHARADDGIPRLVLRRYRYLPPGSVFHRVGWNPLHIAAKRKLWQARFYGSRHRFNYQPKQPWRFWGRRPYLPLWVRGRYAPPKQHNFRGGYRQHQTNKLTTEELVNFQLTQNRKNKEVWSQNQPWPPNFEEQRVLGNPLSLSSEATMRQYPIPRDQYMPPLNRNVRPPSPVGSIISTLSTQAKNPFLKSNHLTTTSYNFANSGFRPTPNTTSLPCTKRFTFSNMYTAVE